MNRRQFGIVRLFVGTAIVAVLASLTTLESLRPLACYALGVIAFAVFVAIPLPWFNRIATTLVGIVLLAMIAEFGSGVALGIGHGFNTIEVTVVDAHGTPVAGRDVQAVIAYETPSGYKSISTVSKSNSGGGATIVCERSVHSRESLFHSRYVAYPSDVWIEVRDANGHCEYRAISIPNESRATVKAVCVLAAGE